MGFNVTTSMNNTNFSLSGLNALAFGSSGGSGGSGGGSIPCYSMAKRNLNYSYVDCASCNRITNWRATGGSGTCTSDGV